MDGEISLFLGGDVMLGRGIDQILARPGDPTLAEHAVHDARDYVRLAERVHGQVPRPVDPAWPWGDALDAYYDEHETMGTGADARSSRMLVIDEGPSEWQAHQILADPAGDHDWRIWATIDLAESADAGTAVVRVTRVGRL